MLWSIGEDIKHLMVPKNINFAKNSFNNSLNKMTEDQIQKLQEDQEEFWRVAEENSALLEITLDYYLMEFC